MKKIIFFLIGIAFMIMLSINYSNGQNLEISCGTDEEVSGDIEERSGDCSTLFNGFLYNHLYDLVPTGTQKIKIKTNCVIVQDENGNGNFSLSNNQERDYLEKIFYYINENLENLYEENCGCQDNPTYYQDIKIEFEPTFFELKDPVLWDHNNDPNPQGHYYGSWHSGYLHEIYDKLKSTPGYTEGFDVYITNDGEDLNNYLNNNPDNLPCDQLDPPCESNYDGHWYSNYPTYNFDQGAFWHAPDLYIRYLQLLNHYAPWEIEDIDPKKVAYGFIHEYGHYFNLGHLFCSKNIMNPGNWNNRGSLDGCQVREMYKSLMTKNIRKFVICESGLDHKIEITNDEVWKLDARIYNDIVVKTGGSLKITCKLYMQPDTKIIVERGAKLFIDGGTITSQCNQWKGIVVQGNVNKEQPPVYQWPNEPDDAGVVLLTNDAVLENFYEGITDNNDYLGWPEMSEYWGGEVVCSNSSFLDGWRAVALMKYDYDDKSLFTGCDFNNLALGVTAWDREVLRFNNNTFNSISRDAIVGENAEIEVEGGNTFENCGRGVWFLSSSPGDGYVHVGGKDLEPNVFNHNDYHVMTAGVIHPKGVEVKYCTMSNAAKNGIYIYGANKARDIGFNNIDGAVYGIKLQDAGQSWQNIRCNDIYNGFDADIAAYYNNNDATFKGNSLNDYRGLYVAGQSGNLGIIPDQLPNGAAPENCFGTSTQEVVTNDETRYFTYYTSADALPGDCRYIDNIFGNYSTEPSQSNYGLPCLDINWPDPPPYSEVDSAIIKMCELLEEQRLNPEDTLLEEEIHVYFREYNDLMMRYTESLFRQRSYNEIIWLLRQVCDKYWKRILVTTLIKDKQYNEALSELNRLETEGVGDQIYKKTQEIKISHLQLGAKFNLENDDKAYLKEAAVAHVPESAYATALLYQLEGESIFDDEILSSRVNPRNEENQEISNANLSIFPNPVRDLLYLEYKDKDESDNLIKIINSLGEIVYEKFFDFENGNMIEIDMSNIPEGTLFISVLKNNGQILASKKIVHVK